jgi:hypothetical protein
MSCNAGTLPPSRSFVPARAIAGLVLAISLGACADNQITTAAPATDPAQPSPSVPAFTDAATSLYNDYTSTASPHFGHVRTQISDYRIGYLSDAATRASEFQWTAQHYDRVILDWGDQTSMPQYRALNPGLEVLRYSLNWSVIQPTSTTAPNIGGTYYPDMQAWFAAHPAYTLESAFLHVAGCGATQSCRVSLHIWNDDRWAVNPGDAGLRAYQRDRLARIAADANGLFLDEHGSGDMQPILDAPPAEYSDITAYQRDIVGMLADEHAALPGKRLTINNATYITSWDADMVRAAGGSHGEYFNNPTFAEMESRWTFAEAALAGGNTLDMTVNSGVPSTYTAGGYATTDERRALWELASYYLVAPSTPGLLYLNTNGSTWSQPFSTTWAAATEANVGLPTGARRVQSEGTDPSGRAYRVWARDYANALVLVRPIISWAPQSYGDETGVSVTLPTDYDYRALRGDGTLGPITTSVTLRASESAILIKQAKPAPVPPPAPVTANPVLLVIDKDAIDVGLSPMEFGAANINNDIAAVGQRAELRYFAAHVGAQIAFTTGTMGGYEGVYAPRSIPASWTAAGPTANGLVNYYRAGPGLGTPDKTGARETLLAKIPDAVPLRATGLKMLIGRTVCAVVMKTNAWVVSYAPISLAFQGPDRGVAAFRVDAVTDHTSSAVPGALPKLTVTILSAAATCGGAMDPLAGAPAPQNTQLPFDVRP